MKSVIIFSVFIVLAQGSVFGEFQEAMSSLKSGLHKFISDVVTDVKETIDCTIIAVETAFSIGSIVSSPLNSKCNGVVYENHDKYETLRDNDKKELLQRARTEFIFDDKRENNYLLNEFLRYLKVTNKKNVEDELNSRSTFETEHNLSNVVAFLKKEIEKISLNVSEELKIIETGQKSTEDYVIKYINLLHTLESKSKNDSELNEVRRILNGVSKIVSVNVSNENDNDKFNESLTSVESKSNNSFNDIQSTIVKNNSKKNSELKSVPQIFNDISKIVQQNFSNGETNVEVNTQSTIAISNSKKYSEFNQAGTTLENASKSVRVNGSNGDTNDEFENSKPSIEPISINKLYNMQSTIAKNNNKKNSELNSVRQIFNNISQIKQLNLSNEESNEKVNKSLTSLDLKFVNNIKNTQFTAAISNSKKYSEFNQAGTTLEDASKSVRVNVSSGDTNDEFENSKPSIEPISINKLYNMQSTIAKNNNKKNSELNSVRQIFNNISQIKQLNLSNEESNDKVNKSLTNLDFKFVNNIKNTQSTVAISSSKKNSELKQATQILNDASKNFQVNVNNRDAKHDIKKSLPSLEPKSNNEKYGTRSKIAQSNSTKNFRFNEGPQILERSSKPLSVKVSNEDVKDKEVTVSTSEPKYYNENKDTKFTTAKSVTSELSSNQSNMHLSTVTFKSIFTKALLTTKSSNVNMENKDDQKFYSTEHSITNDRNAESLDYESIFGHKSGGGSHEEDLDEVRKMFEDSQSLNPILNEIFGKADQSDSNIFDNQI